MRKSIILILLLFSTLLFFSNTTEAACYGTISNVIASYTFDVDAVTEYTKQQAVRINNTEYYAVAYCGVDSDGFIKTFRVFDSNGTISGPKRSYEFCTTDVAGVCITRVMGSNVYVLGWRDTSNSKVRLATTRINDDGTIAGSLIDTQNLDQDGYAITVTQLKGTSVFCVTYYEAASMDGWMETVTITETGAISAVADTQEYDTAYSGYCTSNVQVDTNTIAIAWPSGSSTGDFSLCTYNVSNAGAITNTACDLVVIINNPRYYISIIKVAATMYAVTYVNDVHDVYSKTYSIDTDGRISNAAIDTITIMAGTVIQYLNSFVVDNPANFTEGVLATTFRGPTAGEEGLLYTWNCTDAGAMDADPIDYLEFGSGTGNAGDSNLIHVSGDYYIIVFNEDDTTGKVSSCTIKTEVPPVPTSSNPAPANGATGVSINTSQWTVNTTLTTSGTIQMNQRLLSGGGYSFIKTQTWTSQAAGTRTCTFPGVGPQYLNADCNYSFYVNFTAGGSTYYDLYYFETEPWVQPHSHNPNPNNRSVWSPVNTTFSITIHNGWMDAAGSGTIEILGESYYPGDDLFAGLVTMTPSANLPYSTNITVYVNWSNSGPVVRQYFWFYTNVLPNTFHAIPANRTHNVPIATAVWEWFTHDANDNTSFGTIESVLGNASFTGLTSDASVLLPVALANNTNYTFYVNLTDDNITTIHLWYWFSTPYYPYLNVSTTLVGLNFTLYITAHDFYPGNFAIVCSIRQWPNGTNTLLDTLGFAAIEGLPYTFSTNMTRTTDNIYYCVLLDSDTMDLLYNHSSYFTVDAMVPVFNYTITNHTVSFTSNLTTADHVDYRDTSNYSYWSWDFGDGSYLSGSFSSQRNPSHTYLINWSLINDSINYVNYTVNHTGENTGFADKYFDSRVVSFTRPAGPAPPVLIVIPTDLILAMFGILVLIALIYATVNQTKGILKVKK